MSAGQRSSILSVVLAGALVAAASAEPSGSSIPERTGSPPPIVDLAGGAVEVTDLQVSAPASPLAPEPARTLTLHNYRAAGPAASRPRVALLMLPCSGCGAGWLDPLARDLSGRGGVSVFTMDRRGVALEDRVRLDRLKVGATAEAADAIAYYLGAGGGPALWDRPGAERLGFMALWGSRLMHEDIRAAVREIRRLTSLPVVAGGFSGGAGNVLGFAGRKFDDGRAGHEDVAGVVLLDGATRMERDEDQASLKSGVEAWMSALNLNGAFWDMREDQIRAEIGAYLALSDPSGRSPLASGTVPQNLARAGMTNQAFFGWALDFGRAPDRGFLGGLYQLQIGSLIPPAVPGRLTEWMDGGGAEPTRLAQVAAAARAPGGIFDWYYPSRLVREETELFISGYNDSNLGVTEVERIAVPLFTVTTGTMFFQGREKPPLSGTWLFARIPARGNEAYSYPELRHGDILFADVARATVFAPLHRWLMNLEAVAGAPGRTPSP